MATNPKSIKEQSSIEDSPTYTGEGSPFSTSNQEELHLLAQAINLEYPPNPKQVNKAALVLSYLLGRGMTTVLSFIHSIPEREFYIDSFAKEIYLLHHSDTISVYVKSEPVQVPLINSGGAVKDSTNFSANSEDPRANQNNVSVKADDPNKLQTQEIQYDLGVDPRKDIIEYKLRKELFALIKANPGGIDRLEQMYDARNEISPFTGYKFISKTYFNVLLGGKNRQSYDKLKDIVNNQVDFADAHLAALPADTGGDALDKGGK